MKGDLIDVKAKIILEHNRKLLIDMHSQRRRLIEFAALVKEPDLDSKITMLDTLANIDELLVSIRDYFGKLHLFFQYLHEKSQRSK